MRVKLKWLPTRANAGEVIDKSHWGDGEENLYTCAREPMASDFQGFPDWKRTTSQDLLLTRNGTPYVHLPIAGSIYSNVVQRITVPRQHREYLRYALYAELAQFRGYGVSIESLNYSMWGNLSISLPDLDTQKAIADFLDKETARIDQLIEKKQRFLNLLGDKKTTLLCHLLGSGEEGNADDWLAVCPSEWPRRRAKFAFRERDARSSDGSEELLTASHLTGISRRADNDVNMFLAESNVGYKKVYPGDFVVNTMWAWMGAMGVSALEGIISPSYGIYRPTGEDFEPRYFDLLCRSKPFIAEATRRSKGIHSSRLRLYPDAFLDMRIPIPPRTIQLNLLAEYDRQIAHEQHLRGLTEASIDRLKEYRSALITAAVTGQIDVTRWGQSGEGDKRLDQIQEEMAG